MRIEEPGTYYGQCSELCGVGHNAMPIEIEAVSKEDFASWIETQQAEAGIEPGTGPLVADGADEDTAAAATQTARAQAQ